MFLLPMVGEKQFFFPLKKREKKLTKLPINDTF